MEWNVIESSSPRELRKSLPADRWQMDAGWAPFEAYNVERARTASTQAAVQALMSEFGMPAIAPADLLAFTVVRSWRQVGVPFPTVENLPTPAARFSCNPHCSGKDGGHDIHLRQFAREGMHLYGELKSVEGSTVRFSEDLAARLSFADHRFDEEFRPLFDAYIAAAGIAAPPDDRAPPDDFMPPVVTELDLDQAGIRSLV